MVSISHVRSPCMPESLTDTQSKDQDSFNNTVGDSQGNCEKDNLPNI